MKKRVILCVSPIFMFQYHSFSNYFSFNVIKVLNLTFYFSCILFVDCKFKIRAVFVVYKFTTAIYLFSVSLQLELYFFYVSLQQAIFVVCKFVIGAAYVVYKFTVRAVLVCYL